MTAIGAVIFDLGGVLVKVDFTRGLFPILIERSKALGAPGERLVREQLFGRFGRGQTTPVEFHRELCRAAGLDLTFDDFVRQWCDVFDPMEGMEQLLGEVAGRVQVGILSDTDPLHWGYLTNRFPYLRKVERPTLSFQTGLLKPAPESYLAAAKNAGVPPSACFFTDDLVSNVAGAREVGMQAELFQGAESLRSTLAGLGVL